MSTREVQSVDRANSSLALRADGWMDAATASRRRMSATVLPEAAVRNALANLLEAARQALCRDANEARRCIAAAAALLQADGDLRKPERQCCPQLLAPWQLTRVLQFVESNLANPVRIEEFAATVRLSPSYFSYAFRCSVGEPPFSYVRRRRIERAQQMMLLTDKPLADIALECGLADQPHLTKMFRRIVGMCPGAWRRLHRSSRAATS